jgi:hypothetical protein
MSKLTWILVAAASTVAGCTPMYRVHVNTYSELGEPLNHAAPIYIAVDPNSQNPILRRQIASKIRVLLEGGGYTPVDKMEAAAYMLTFEAGMDSERVLDYAPISRPYGGYYGGGYYGRGFGMGLGYTTYMPYVDTIYTHWLRMRLYDLKAAGQKPEGGAPPRLTGRQTVWQGEALVGMDSPELREAVNYLLVGGIEYLGADTEEWVTVKIKADDPRILGIESE